MRLVRVVLLVGMAAALAGCGGGGKAYIPVDSPLKPWEPPEIEDSEQAEAPPATPADKPAE